jgi:phage terminase large subunit-like protein
MTWKLSAATLRNALSASLAPGQASRLLAGLSRRELETIDGWWPLFAREDQLPPDTPWRTWLMLGGRGAGKTRAGAEWVRAAALGLDHGREAPARRIALVAETAADLREVMIEGRSGLLAIHSAPTRPAWEPSRRRLVWPNGAIAQAFSAEEPDSLRGPEFDAAWVDELAKWRYPDLAWDMLQMALRIGPRPRIVATTTPRPIALLKRLLADPSTAVARATTAMNRANLAAGFVEAMQARYAGTRLGRQELDGEIVEETGRGLFTRAIFDDTRLAEAPALRRVVVAVDPPASPSGVCGIVAAGRGEDGRFYVLDDASLEGARPTQWASRAVELFHRREADRIVAEINQGGDMVEAVIREADPAVPIATVRAIRGKWLRAEPVAALYDQGRVSHVGALARLEDEMCDFTPEGRAAGHSPDRVDALVWAITALSQDRGGEPRIHAL